MQSYLSGRGGIKEDNDGTTNSQFRPFLQSKDTDQTDTVDDLSDKDLDSQVIYDEANCPKVEVLSEEGIAQEILIHLQDGRILKIQCQY
ncbi:MAG: hypothetical protein VXZ37_01535 [Verrucomicrobiota bacterium]|nr:hypothetical protein [Verrucomicrobiota bacterium]